MDKRISFIAVILLILSLGTGCKKDLVEPEPVEINNNQNGQIGSIPEATDVKKFIYNALSTYYLWEKEVPKLNYPIYNNNKDSLNAFLNKFNDPEELFYSLLYKYGTIDKWSFIADDAKEIENWIAGISESMGYNFGLAQISSNSDNLVGFVRYVIKGSPADQAGIKRGDLFLTIDGNQLTIGNYRQLLYTKISYTAGFASETSPGVFALNGKTATMTAVNIQENPLHLDTVLNVNGLKVGYLVYNSFNGSYNEDIQTTYNLELNKVFGRFKSAGVQKLIIDLRYNPGGSVLTSTYLASMIYSTDTKKILFKYQFNDLLQNTYRERYGDDYFNEYFENKISKTSNTPEMPVNSLELNEVYVITTKRSASASELLINCLKEYINVIQVGENTSGKYTGSFTIKDLDNEGKVNPNHKWAMQPITLKFNNVRNVSDFVDGLAPTIQRTYVFHRLQPFGDPEEQLLKIALDHIKGLKSATVSPVVRMKEFAAPEAMAPFMQMMYVEPDRFDKPSFQKAK